MEKDDKASTMIRMGVSGWMFLLVPAYPGCPGSKAVKRSLLLLCFQNWKTRPQHIRSTAPAYFSNKWITLSDSAGCETEPYQSACGVCTTLRHRSEPTMIRRLGIASGITQSQKPGLVIMRQSCKSDTSKQRRKISSCRSMPGWHHLREKQNTSRKTTGSNST